MKIAIYGDSFGCIIAEKIPDDKNHSWPHSLILHSSYISNFSKVGKSFMSAYSDYILHKHKYDVNIFLVTKIGRIDFPQLEKICKPYFTNKLEVYFNRRAVNNNKTSVLTDEQKNLANKLFDYAETYFDHIENFLYYEYLSRQALIEKAMKFPEYTIFIPCFESNAVPNSMTPLVDIFNFENEHLKINELNGGKSFGDVVDGKFANDIRQCHLTKENNKLILDKILRAIETKSKTIDLKVKDFKIPTCDVSECFEWIQVP